MGRLREPAYTRAWKRGMLFFSMGIFCGSVALGGDQGGKPTFGQAMSKQKQEDWEGAISVYTALIEDLWESKPDSILLPKSYMGLAYCGLNVGDLDLAANSLRDIWSTGAFANPNLPKSPEYEAYRALAEERHADAIRAFVILIEDLPEGTKRWQEAKIGLAATHMLVGTARHYDIARENLEDVIEQAGDSRITAFAQWLNGLTLLSYFDVIGAQTSFEAAATTDPTMDPSESAMEILDDQLSPAVNVSSSLGQNGDDLLQLGEDYANAWYLTVNGRVEEANGNTELAETLYQEADALWGQENVASQTYGN